MFSLAETMMQCYLENKEKLPNPEIEGLQLDDYLEQCFPSSARHRFFTGSATFASAGEEILGIILGDIEEFINQFYKGRIWSNEEINRAASFSEKRLIPDLEKAISTIKIICALKNISNKDSKSATEPISYLRAELDLNGLSAITNLLIEQAAARKLITDLCVSDEDLDILVNFAVFQKQYLEEAKVQSNNMENIEKEVRDMTRTMKNITVTALIISIISMVTALFSLINSCIHLS